MRATKSTTPLMTIDRQMVVYAIQDQEVAAHLTGTNSSARRYPYNFMRCLPTADVPGEVALRNMRHGVTCLF